jgi:hypothetical protein
MPRLHPASLVVAFLLLRNSRTTTLDLLARVSVLARVAGVKPGTWMLARIPKRRAPRDGALVGPPAPRYGRRSSPQPARWSCLPEKRRSAVLDDASDAPSVVAVMISHDARSMSAMWKAEGVGERLASAHGDGDGRRSGDIPVRGSVSAASVREL